MATSKIDGIPVYEALVDDERDGMVRISLVDLPAVLTGWQAYSGQMPLRFAVADEDKRLIRGVVMRADFPIYRADDSGEYYIIYRADTIRRMAEKYLAENRQNRVDTDHSGDEVRGVQMVQWFIKDTERGIAPAGFDDVADGSLFAEFHIADEALWNEVKAGTYRGFSLEGFFSFIPDQDQRDIDAIVDELEGAFKANNSHEYMAKIEKTLARLRELLEAANKPAPVQKCGRVTTDRGVLAWPGEEDLKAGDPVTILDQDGNEVRPEDGDYKTEDGKTIVVADGIVAEIRDPEAEVAPEGGEGEGNEPEQAQEASAKFRAIRTAFEESYDEKFRKIAEAVKEYINSYDFYIAEAGDDFAVVGSWGPDGEKFIRYEVSWTEEGNAVVNNPTEVRPAFVPVENPAAPAEPSAAEEELRTQLNDALAANKTLEAEAEALREQVAALKAQPAAKPAHEEVRDAAALARTGNKGVDRLNELMRR